jgi:hypothetical protein
MNDMDYGAKAVEQLAIFDPIVLECCLSISKKLEDVLDSDAALESVGGGMMRKVDPGLLSVAVQCSIED